MTAHRIDVQLFLGHYTSAQEVSMFRKCSLAGVILLLLVADVLMLAQNSPVGYTDTPMLPGLPYRVHDPARPHPQLVMPPARSESAPPSDALVLFSGQDL